MYRIRIVLILLGLALLATLPVTAQEATPASDADVALLDAATDQLFGADTILIALDIAFFIGQGGDEALALLDLQLTGSIALDIANEIGSADLSLLLDGETQDIQIILDGDTLYLGSEGEWFGTSLADLVGSALVVGDGTDATAAELPELDFSPHSEMLRLADEGGFIQLQSRLNLLTLAADPGLGALVGAAVTDDVAAQAGMTSEELAALLPLLAFIIQEPRVETTYRIDPGSGQLRAVSADIGGAINPAALGAEGAPITIDIQLDLGFTQDVAVSIGEIPTDVTIVPFGSFDALLPDGLP